jgi:hypothetical protein
MLPAAFSSVSTLTSIAGGLAAAIAVGAFIGQAYAGLRPMSEQERRRFTAVGGLIGLGLIIGLFLYSGK